MQPSSRARAGGRTSLATCLISEPRSTHFFPRHNGENINGTRTHSQCTNTGTKPLRLAVCRLQLVTSFVRRKQSRLARSLTAGWLSLRSRLLRHFECANERKNDVRSPPAARSFPRRREDGRTDGRVDADGQTDQRGSNRGRRTCT